jgi:hypothetical protein
MKFLLLVLVLSATAHAVDVVEVATSTTAAAKNALAIEAEARELRGLNLGQFVPQKAHPRFNQDDNPPTVDNDPVDPSGGQNSEGTSGEPPGQGNGNENEEEAALEEAVEEFEALTVEDKNFRINKVLNALSMLLDNEGDRLEVPVYMVEETVVLLEALVNNIEDNDESSDAASSVEQTAAEQRGFEPFQNEKTYEDDVIPHEPNMVVQQDLYEVARRKQRRNRGYTGHHHNHRRVMVYKPHHHHSGSLRRSHSRRQAVTHHHSSLLRRSHSRRQAITYHRGSHSWTSHGHHRATSSRFHRSLDVPYAGNAANFQNVPDLLVLVSGAATIYNTVFSPLPQNGVNPPNGLQQAVYYLQMYATIRNFAISFSANRAGIENNLNQVLTNVTALGFSKNEMLAFYGYLDLVNSLKLSTQAFTAPFIAQDQALNTVLTNFTNTLKAIVQNINFLMAQDEAVAQATKGLTSNDPTVANPTMKDLQRIDATLLLIPNLLTIYINIQNAITDLQAQLNNLQAIRTQIQVSISNMQLIVNGKAEQLVPASADKLLTVAIVALIYGIAG